MRQQQFALAMLTMAVASTFSISAIAAETSWEAEKEWTVTESSHQGDVTTTVAANYHQKFVMRITGFSPSIMKERKPVARGPVCVPFF